MKYEEEKGVNVIFQYESGIYFLIRGEEVVYVGQSKNCFTRICHHFGNKEFNKVILYPCKISELDYYEDFFIKKYKPEYNKASNYEMNFSANKIKKIFKERLNFSTSPSRILYICKKMNINIYIDDFTKSKNIYYDDFLKLYSLIYSNYVLFVEIEKKTSGSNALFKKIIDLIFEKGDIMNG